MQNRQLSRLGLWMSGLLMCVALPMKGQTATTNLKIDLKETQAFSPYIFGHNLEHTRACINTGLSAQMLQNRKFAGMSSKNQGVAFKWFAIGGTDAFFLMNDHDHYTRHDGLFEMHRKNELYAQDIQNLNAGKRVGIGQGGIALQQRKRYEMRTVTKVNLPTTLKVELTDRTGGVCYGCAELQLIPGDEWQTNEFTITSTGTDMDGCVRYTYTEGARVRIGALSMLPEGHFHGMRPDVVDNLREIGPTVLRWPGGNFAGEYRWMDGLLPVDMRGPLQAAMEIETQPYSDGYDFHEINTDDFIALCREVGAEPFLTINPVWNTPEDSANWVEYCNGPVDTEYGRIRAERGHVEPYNVRFWSLGNEMGFEHMEGPKGPAGYAAMAGRHADAMLEVSPGLELWSSGPYPNDDWAEQSAAVLSDRAKYVSQHNYSSPEHNFNGSSYRYTTPEEIESTYNGIVTSCYSNLDLARRMRASLDATGKEMHISFDEWNQWFSWYRPSCVGEGIFTARMLHIFMTESNALDMPICCYFQPVGEGAILITPTESRLTANGQMFSIMKEHKGGALCRIDGDDEYLALASVKDDILTVTLINPDYSTDREFNFDAKGDVQSSALYSSDDVRPYTYFTESALTVFRKGKSLKTILPAHSVAIIRVTLR